MILYYTESELFDYNSIDLISYTGYEFYTIFDTFMIPDLSVIDKLAGVYNSPLVDIEEMEIYTDDAVYSTQLLSNINIRQVLNGTNNDTVMVWILIEQISPDSYVRLSGIKIKGSPVIYPLKVDVYNERFYIYQQSSGYCYMLTETCKLENSTQRYKSGIRELYIDRIKRIFRELYKITIFNDDISLSELEKYIDTQVADNISLYGDGIISEKFYNINRDLSTGQLFIPSPSGEELFENVNSINVKAVVDEMLKPVLLSNSLNSKLVSYVKNGVIKLNVTQVLTPGTELVPPSQYGHAKFDYIEGDYLLTPNICSSINNFNFGKYGHLFINLNTDCNLYILQPELMLKIDSIFSDVLVINMYADKYSPANYKYLIDQLYEPIEEWVTEHTSAEFGAIYYTQITKTIMGDVVVTLFDEDRQLVSAFYYNSVIEVLNRPNLLLWHG